MIVYACTSLLVITFLYEEEYIIVAPIIYSTRQTSLVLYIVKSSIYIHYERQLRLLEAVIDWDKTTNRPKPQEEPIEEAPYQNQPSVPCYDEAPQYGVP